MLVRKFPQARPDELGAPSSTQMFARRLRAAMQERGWSGAETARRVREKLGNGAKFSPANIAHYTNGRSRPRLRTLSVLAEVLGKPEGFFLEAERTCKDVDADQKELPSLHLADSPSEIWLQINQRVPWPVAMRVFQVLAGEEPE
jgi:transcriptional regulator with XRE-family HTH domain